MTSSTRNLQSKPSPLVDFALAYGVWILALLLAVTVVYWNLHLQEKKENIRLTLLKDGSLLVDKRRFAEAQEKYQAVEKFAPQSVELPEARRRIATGIREEQEQYISYWTGQAQAFYEAGRWDDAEKAAREALAKLPHEGESTRILEKIYKARAAADASAQLATGKTHIQNRRWAAALELASKILATNPSDMEAKSILTAAQAGQARAALDLESARKLLVEAKAKDQGKYDAGVLAAAREASRLAPDDKEIEEFLTKISTYFRTLRVPGEYATPAEALAKAEPHDRILITGGTWQGPLVVDVAVELVGVADVPPVIDCPVDKGAAITFSPGASGTQVLGLVFRHSGIDTSSGRFSVAEVRGATVELRKCEFRDAGGHGLLVMEGGKVIAAQCKFTGNGWDGAAVFGAGSSLVVRDSVSQKNTSHGLEAWDNAALMVSGTSCAENALNGIHADCGHAALHLHSNQLRENREFGLVITSAASGEVSANAAKSNTMGGIVVGKNGESLAVTRNLVSLNQGPGLVLENGLNPTGFSSNTVKDNSGQQTMAEADLFKPLPSASRAVEDKKTALPGESELPDSPIDPAQGKAKPLPPRPIQIR